MRRASLVTTALLLGSWPAASVAAEPEPAEAAAEPEPEPEPTAPAPEPTEPVEAATAEPEPTAPEEPEPAAFTTTEPAATEPEPTEPAATEPEPAERSKPARMRLSQRRDRPWIHRWAPEPNTTEVGVFGGMLVTSPRVELFEADFMLPFQGYRPFARVAPDFGLRASFFPVRFVGSEIEAAAMPTRTDLGQAALIYSVRGALVAQLALWSVTPFVLVGGGMLGVTSDRSAVGNDVDMALHAGGGVKVYLGRFTHVRLDVRDVVTARRGYQAGLSNNPEILLGVGMTLGRRRDRSPRERRSTREPEAAATEPSATTDE